MDEILIPSDNLRRVADEFASASKESQAIMKRLEKATTQLEEKWAGATHQIFHKNYKDWRAHMQIYAVLLDSIARELNGIADRFEHVDG